MTDCWSHFSENPPECWGEFYKLLESEKVEEAFLKKYLERYPTESKFWLGSAGKHGYEKKRLGKKWDSRAVRENKRFRKWLKGRHDRFV